MTPRSPKQHQATLPKTTTISRKLRNRADQNLSIQPPELAHLRGLRTQRRATTLPSVRRTSDNYLPGETQRPTAWNPNVLDAYTRSTTSHPTALVQNLHSDLSHPLDLHSYHPHRTSVSTSSGYEVLPSSDSDLLPSPLPSLSGSHTATEFELRLSVEPEAPHNSSLELQDMR
jgi:hypothetical protein